MTEPLADFFEQLQGQDPEPLLAKATGTVRFDVVQDDETDVWFVRVDKGHVDVSRESGDDVTAVVRGPKSLFEALRDGKANAMSAMLRNELTFEGDAELLLLLQRVFPGPRRSTHPRAVTGASS